MRACRILNCLFVVIVLFSASNKAIQASAELPVTSSFGWRYHPVDGQYKFHTGIDLGYSYGDNVPALFPGQVVAAGDYGDGYGNQVMLYHQYDNTYTKYCHLSYICVAQGEYVNQGQIIGNVGSSGYSTGPHLHLEYIICSSGGGYEFADPMALWT